MIVQVLLLLLFFRFTQRQWWQEEEEEEKAKQRGGGLKGVGHWRGEGGGERRMKGCVNVVDEMYSMHVFRNWQWSNKLIQLIWSLMIIMWHWNCFLLTCEHIQNSHLGSQGPFKSLGFFNRSNCHFTQNRYEKYGSVREMVFKEGCISLSMVVFHNVFHCLVHVKNLANQIGLIVFSNQWQATADLHRSSES